VFALVDAGELPKLLLDVDANLTSANTHAILLASVAFWSSILELLNRGGADNRSLGVLTVFPRQVDKRTGICEIRSATAVQTPETSGLIGPRGSFEIEAVLIVSGSRSAWHLRFPPTLKRDIETQPCW
jgi:hypothetical protein